MPWVTERIQNLGFKEITPNPWTFNMDSKTDVLILDSYTVDLNDYFIDMNSWYRVVTIADDSTPQYPSNLKINNHLMGRFQSGSESKVLSGPSYFSLRKNIENLCHLKLKIRYFIF